MIRRWRSYTQNYTKEVRRKREMWEGRQWTEWPPVDVILLFISTRQRRVDDDDDNKEHVNNWRQQHVSWGVLSSSYMPSQRLPIVHRWVAYPTSADYRSAATLSLVASCYTVAERHANGAWLTQNAIPAIYRAVVDSSVRRGSRRRRRPTSEGGLYEEDGRMTELGRHSVSLSLPA